MEDVQINAVDPNVTSSSDSPPEIPDPQLVSDTTEKSKIGDTPMDERDDSMVCDPNSRLVLSGFTKANHSGSFRFQILHTPEFSRSGSLGFRVSPNYHWI